MSKIESLAAADLLRFVGKQRFGTILADPPWQFTNKTGKVAPEHKRLSRYSTMTLDEIKALPVAQVSAPVSHLYLWCPNAFARRPCRYASMGLSLQSEYRLA